MWLAGASPALLDPAEELPHGLAHGDATPANLHEPGDGTLVAFDWSYGSSGPVGSDLGQLLAGRFDFGLAEPDDLPAIAETIFDGFDEGLDDEGHPPRGWRGPPTWPFGRRSRRSCRTVGLR